MINSREHTKTEKELKGERKFLRNIMATLPDSLLILDRDLRIKSANHSFYKLFHTRPKRVIGSKIADILGDEDGKLSAKLTQLFGTKAILENFELHYQSEKLGEQILNITARGIIVEEEELVVMQDITERKRAEDERARLGHDLLERVKELRCFYSLDIAVEESSSIDEFLNRVVSLIPLAMQYPELARSGITFRSHKYQSKDFTESKHNISADIKVADKVVGSLGVYYSEERPFLKEEVDLVTGLAERIGKVVEGIEAKEMLQESEKRFRALIENSSDIIQVVDSKGVIRYVSPSVQRILGYRPEELIGRPSVDIVHPDDLPIVARGFKEALEKPEVPQVTVCRCKHKDGTWRLIEGIGVNQLDNPAVNGFIANMHDITERKQAEEALRRSEEKYRTTFENTGTAMAIVEEDTTISLVNHQFEILTSYSKEEIEGKKSWTEFVYQEDLERMKEYHRRRREPGGKAPTEYEFRFVDKAGNIKNIFLTVEVIPGTKKSITSLMDITKRKQAEEQLERSFIDLAETVSRAMGSRDPYTSGHQRRVAELARLVGEKMGLDKDRLTGLYIGGLLHDIGKASIPESILSKPGKLSEEEWALVRAHTKQGYKILKDTKFPWPVAEMALHHHERMDGSGYPDGISGDEISLENRILGVCDVVEAMSSFRPYRPARSLPEILKELSSGRGTKYDADIVDVMLELIESGEFEFGWEARIPAVTEAPML